MLLGILNSMFVAPRAASVLSFSVKHCSVFLLLPLFVLIFLLVLLFFFVLKLETVVKWQLTNVAHAVYAVFQLYLTRLN